LEGSSFVLLESNYDPDVLKYTKYPFALKKRIAGPTGHLSNIMAGKVINYLSNCGLNTAMLGHLSKESNFPELAYKTVADEIISAGTDISKINLSVASRDTVGSIIHI
jgi:phosphoribosyl 1,2-cyclic phosphodiesterase